MSEYSVTRASDGRHWNGPHGPVPGDENQPVLASIDVRQLFGIVRRQIWFLVAGAALGVGLSAYLVKPDQLTYTAKSSVRVNYDRRSLTGGITVDPALDASLGANPIQSQLQILTSETVLSTVVDEHGLRLQPLDGSTAVVLRDVQVSPDLVSDTVRMVFLPGSYRIQAGSGNRTATYGESVGLGELGFVVPRRPEADSAAFIVVTRPAAVNLLRRNLNVRQRDRTDVIDVTYTTSDPARARDVANAIAQTAQSVSGRFAQQQAERRRIFVEQQSQQTDAELATAQAELSWFRSQSEFYSARDGIAVQEAQLRELERRREEIVAERNSFASLLSTLQGASTGESGFRLRALLGTPGLAENTQNRIVGELYARLVTYETERSNLTSGPFARSDTDPDVERLDVLIRDTQGNLLDAVRGHVASLDTQLAALEGFQVRERAAMRNLPEREAEESRLLQEVDILRQLSAQQRVALAQARIAETVEAGQLEVLDLAGSASSNTGRSRTMTVLWVFMGLMLGGGAGLLRETIDRSVKGPDDLEALLHIPELGIIPPIAAQNGYSMKMKLPAAVWRRVRGQPTAGVGNSRQTSGPLDLASAEAFRLLRTNLSFLTVHPVGEKLRTILITSSDPGEGKTTTTANLAMAFARQGQRVLLVDADLHRPALHRALRLALSPGLAQYLTDSAVMTDIIHATSVPNLFLIPAGRSDQSDLLSDTEQIKAMIERLSGSFDLIIIDTPPVRATADATFLSTFVDGVIVVVRAGRTDRNSLRRVVKGLQAVGANLVGAVLNDPDAEVPRYAGNYNYPHAYYASAEGPRQASR